MHNEYTTEQALDELIAAMAWFGHYLDSQDIPERTLEQIDAIQKANGLQEDQ